MLGDETVVICQLNSGLRDALVEFNMNVEPTNYKDVTIEQEKTKLYDKIIKN